MVQPGLAGHGRGSTGAACTTVLAVTRRAQARTILGYAEMTSHFFSNEWRLEQDDQRIARMRRYPRQRTSRVLLDDDTMWEMKPRGWGTVVIFEDDKQFAQIDRRSWWGRLWEIRSPGYALDLVSHPLPRRWRLAIGGEPIAEMSGSMVSYNRLRMNASIGVPVAAALLAWQVVVRPWEAASFPVGKVPATIGERRRLPELPEREGEAPPAVS